MRKTSRYELSGNLYSLSPFLFLPGGHCITEALMLMPPVQCPLNTTEPRTDAAYVEIPYIYKDNRNN